MTQQQIPRPNLPDLVQYEQQTNRMRTHLWAWMALGAVVAGVLAAAVWGLGWPSTTAATHTVVYTATADAAYGSGRTGMVTAQGPDGTVQQTGLLPITGTYDTFHSGDFVYLSVQNQQSLGSVTCRITVDGVVVSENTSSGGYTIATCQGKVP